MAWYCARVIGTGPNVTQITTDTSCSAAPPRSLIARRCRSALQAGVRDPLHDLPLEQQERDEQRQRPHDRERHDLRVLRAPPEGGPVVVITRAAPSPSAAAPVSACGG